LISHQLPIDGSVYEPNRTMSYLTGKTRLAFLCFFASHIPITLMIDAQAFLPHSFFPQIALDVVKWYTNTFNDQLMTPPYDTWFSAVVGCEIFLQLPFFFVAVHSLWTNGRSVDGSGWFRTACLVYGSHTATTMAPILATIWNDISAEKIQKAFLFSVYLPYLLFPLWLVFIAATSENVFGPAPSKPKVS